MTKNFIFNVVLNLGILFLIMSAVTSYQKGYALYLGLSIAFLVVLVYLKVVLLRQVNREVKEKYAQRSAPEKDRVGKKKK